MLIRAPAILVLVLCTVASVHSLSQEQAERYTWHQQFVGKVLQARTDNRPRSRIYVATEKNVVAALSPKDGSIAWRKVFGQGDAISHLEVDSGKVFTLSGRGTMLRAFEADSGQMLWAAPLGGPPSSEGGYPPAMDLVLLRAGEAHLVVAALGATVQAFTAAKGKSVWTIELPTAGSPAPVQLLAASETLWAAAVHPSQREVLLVELSSSGDVLRQAAVASGMALSREQLALTQQAVAVVSEAGSQICVAPLTGSQAGQQLQCLDLKALLPEAEHASFPSFVRGACASHAVLRVASGVAVLSLEGGSSVGLVKYADGGEAAASACLDTAQGPLVALTHPRGNFTLEVFSAADGSVLHHISVPQVARTKMDDKPVSLDRAWLLPFRQAGGKASVRPLLVLEDHTLALLPPLTSLPAASAAAAAAGDDGSPAVLPPVAPSWSRLEALAGVTSALLVDLPAPSPEHEASWQARQPGLGASLHAQLLTLKGTLGVLSPEEAQALAAHRGATNDRLRPTRDPDGFRKQILVVTEAGKVVSLHTGDGRVLWQQDFGATAPSRLVPWLIPTDPEDVVEVAALHPDLDSLASLDAYTGELSTVHTVDFEKDTFGEVVQLPGAALVDSEDPFTAYNASTSQGEPSQQRIYAIVPRTAREDEDFLRLLPDGPPTWSHLRAVAANFSYWTVDRPGGVVRGYGVSPEGDVQERWAAVLAPPGSGLAILEVAEHASREAVQSQAKVLGDGSLKFKYLNSNTLLVAVGPPAGSASQRQPGSSEEEPSLTVYLLDGVTGKVLHAQMHKGARGPVHAVLCEHWAVYHFWNVEQHRWQMSVAELYVPTPQDVRLLDLAFTDVSFQISSWDTQDVEVLFASFFTRLPVTQLDVTRTAHGITARQLLLSTPSGQVYMMDKRFLDPRRPGLAPGAKPTPEMQAEGLVPYVEELPFSTLMYATLDKQVQGLRGVVTEPSALESTALMFAHGLDLFYTRLSPSKTFDLLPDDFPYALLVLIVVGMTAASAVLSTLNKRAVLKKKWE